MCAKDKKNNTKECVNTVDARQGWISAVVPVYNRGGIILDTLESIQNQSFRPIEIVVVDDGSTDDTLAIVKQWAGQSRFANDFKIRVVSQSNQGANAARNRGLSEARGEFIAFLDSDDRWFPQKLEKQMDVFRKNPAIGGVYCGLGSVDIETGERRGILPRIYPQGDLLGQMLIHDVTEATSAWMVRKTCFDHVGMFDLSLPARQDWDMWIRLSEKYRIGAVPEVLAEMGEHAGERVRSDPAREIAAHKTIYVKYRYLRIRFPFWVSLAARGAMYRRRGRVYFHRNISRTRALKLYLLAIMVWPFCFDSYAALGGMVFPRNTRQKLHGVWNRIFGKTRLGIRSH